MWLSNLLAAILRLFERPAPSVSPSKPSSAAPAPVPPATKPVVPSAVVGTQPAAAVPVPAPPPVSWLTLCRPMTEHFETCYLIAYPDPASPLGKALRARGLWQATLKGAPIPADLHGMNGTPWTCGWGSTGPDVFEGIVWTQSHADSRLTIQLDEAADEVDRLVKVVLTAGQKAALVDFTYNEGDEHLATSTLLKLLNAGNYQSAADALLEWDMAGGEKLPGLDARRHANRTLFLTGAWQP